MMKFAVTLIVGVSLVFGGSAHAWFLDFELGLTQNVEDAASGVPGLQFNDSTGDDWLSFDIQTGDYTGTAFDQIDGQADGTSDAPYSKPGGSDFLSLSPTPDRPLSEVPNNQGAFYSYDDIYDRPSGDSSDIPEPATLLLLGAGLIAGGIARRKAHK